MACVRRGRRFVAHTHTSTRTDDMLHQHNSTPHNTTQHHTTQCNITDRRYSVGSSRLCSLVSRVSRLISRLWPLWRPPLLVASLYICRFSLSLWSCSSLLLLALVEMYHPLISPFVYPFLSLSRSLARASLCLFLYPSYLFLCLPPLPSSRAVMRCGLCGLCGCDEQGRHDEALRMLERSLEIWKRVYGPDHANVGTGLNNLAGVLETMVGCVG